MVQCMNTEVLIYLFIEVKLTYNIILVSAVQHEDSTLVYTGTEWNSAASSLCLNLALDHRAKVTWQSSHRKAPCTLN